MEIRYRFPNAEKLAFLSRKSGARNLIVANTDSGENLQLAPICRLKGFELFSGMPPINKRACDAAPVFAAPGVELVV
jgi:spore coat polysaccharide biosynthesis protein SpsF (cytidylyltransferase family)